MGFERIRGLVDERPAVGQEQHPLDPASLHQLVDEGDHGAGFAGARCHHQQCLTLAAFEGVIDGPDRALLIVALNDPLVDHDVGEGKFGGATLDGELEFVLGVEASDFSRG